MKALELHISDGTDDCALCTKKIRKGHSFVLAQVRLLLREKPQLNICLGCIGGMVDETKKRVRKR